MPNHLHEGQTRLGFIFDGVEESPHVAVQLSRTTSRIEMQLPWYEDYNGIHRRWFGDDAHWGDDPDKTRFRYQVPERITFVDPSGPLALVGCTSAGFTSNLVFGV